MKLEKKRDELEENHSLGFSVLYYALKKVQNMESKLINSYKKLEEAHSEVIASQEALRNQFNQVQLNKEAFRISEERFRLAIEGSNDCIWDWDINLVTVHISLAWANTLGFEKQDISNCYQAWMDLIHSEDVEKVGKSLQECLDSLTESYICEYRIKKNNGEYIWILSKGKVLCDEDGKPIRMAGSHTDITHRKNSESKIYQLAYYDSLTGLPNKALFMEKLNASIQNSITLDERGALFFIDIDNFKNINDTYGHNVGDNFLREVANRLKMLSCESQMIARHGGDEFIIMCPNIGTRSEIRLYAKKVMELFSEPWTVNWQDFFATISMGITVYPDDGQNTDELLKNADMAMYKAKDCGKNNYQFYEPSMYLIIMEKTRMEKNLRKAIDNNELVVYYQPQVGLKSEKLIGMEALVRWDSVEEGLIYPDQFIPLAEETGLIVEVGKHVLRSACIQNKKWQESGLGFFSVSVNISTLELRNDYFIEVVKDVLEETALDPKYLKIEITESVIMDNFDLNFKILKELMSIGIEISLDDFGTGYSSLSYLNRLPINHLKIDKSFVNGMRKDMAKESIIETIINLSHKMNLQVIAEGVEMKEQQECLIGMGCDAVQGYYLSQPLPTESITNLLSKQHFEI